MLALRLFGPFEARLDGTPMRDLRLRTGERLLAFLALQSGREVPASLLAHTFWPEQGLVEGEMEKALASLRASVRHLRMVLREEGVRLVAERNVVSFHP